MRWGLPPHPVFALSAAPTLPLEAHAKNDIAVFSANASPNTDGAPPTIPTNPPINRLPNQPLRQSANSTLARNRTFFREFPPNQLIHSVLQNYQIGHEIGHGSNHPKGHFQSATPQLNAPLFATIETDVVGYATIHMEGGKWYQFGTPFIALTDGQDGTLNTVFDTGFSTGDRLYVYDTQKSAYTVALTWATLNNVAGWYYGSGKLADITLNPGQAVFVKKGNADGTLTLRGRVSTTEVTTFGLEDSSSWAQITCIYPAEQSINDIVWEGLEKNDEAYIYDSDKSAYATTVSWQTVGGVTGWYLGSGKLATTKLSPGQSIFVHKKTAGIATCAAPTE